MKKILLLFVVFIGVTLANQFEKDQWQDEIPTTAAMYKKMGVNALKEKDIIKSIFLLMKSIEIKEDYYLGYYNLAIANYLKKDLNATFQALNKAYQIAKSQNIKDVNVYILFGYANMLSNKEKEAKEIYEEGLALDNNNSQLLNNYGLLLFRNGEYQKAREYFKQSLNNGYYKAEENIKMIDKIISDINKNANENNNTISDLNGSK